MAREGGSTAPERTLDATPTGSRFNCLDPEGRDEGVASIAALYVPGRAAADVDGAPPLDDPAPARISLVRLLLRVPRHLADLLPASPGRATLVLLGAAAATAAEVLWIPPHVYGATIQVGRSLLVGVAGPLVALFLRSPGRAAWLLVRAAAITAVDALGIPRHVFEAPLRITEGFLLRVVRSLAVLLPTSPGRAAMNLIFAAAATAAEVLWIPQHVYGPAIQVGHDLLVGLAGLLLRACQAPLPIARGFSLRFWNLLAGLLPDTPGRAALMLLCAAAATVAEVVGTPRFVYGFAVQVTFVLLVAAARPLVLLRRRAPGHAALPLLRAAASTAADPVGLPPRAFAALRIAILRAPGFTAVLIVVATVAVLVAAAASLSRRAGGASPSRPG